MLGARRYPHGVVRRREEALAVDVQVHDTMRGVVELAPGVAVGSTVGVGTELVVAEVHWRRELVEMGDVEVFTGHAVCFEGQVVWIRV
ncbi:hypothetical protein D3C76_1381220 [compost metagenome]